MNAPVQRVNKASAARAGIIGIFLIIVGTISDIIGIIFLWQSDSNFDGIFLRRAHGIWAGMLLVVAGFFGLVVWIKLEDTLVKVYALLNILVFGLLFIQLILIIVIVNNFNDYTDVKSTCKITLTDCKCVRFVRLRKERCAHSSWVLKIFVGLLVTTLLGVFASLLASIIGCVAVRQAGKSSVALRPRKPVPTSTLNTNQGLSPSPMSLPRPSSPRLFLAVECEDTLNGHANTGSDIDV